MVSACVLIYCDAGKFPAVLNEVKKLAGVKRAFSVLGRCDVVAEIEAVDVKTLSEITWKITRLLGVTATETLMEALI
ncbi:MAG: AsnC family protein [Candidatus Bathyarchaeota archaeon BA2]|nr:MAG: AsnC family protein [Candidatus Bathyarchaeota archaeon BA2]